jgi:hypothetical protein
MCWQKQSPESQASSVHVMPERLHKFPQVSGAGGKKSY